MCALLIFALVFSQSSFADFVVILLVSELEIKAQKENFEKQSYTIKSDAEVKLAEVQALLEAERDCYRTEVIRALCVLNNVA